MSKVKAGSHTFISRIFIELMHAPVAGGAL